MKNYEQSGDVLTLTAVAAVQAGDYVVIGGLRGVADADAAIGVDFNLHRTGSYSFTAANADVIAVGDALFWNAANREVTTTAGGNEACGSAVTGKAAATDGSVEVVIV